MPSPTYEKTQHPNVKKNSKNYKEQLSNGQIEDLDDVIQYALKVEQQFKQSCIN